MYNRAIGLLYLILIANIAGAEEPVTDTEYWWKFSENRWCLRFDSRSLCLVDSLILRRIDDTGLSFVDRSEAPKDVVFLNYSDRESAIDLKNRLIDDSYALADHFNVRGIGIWVYEPNVESSAQYFHKAYIVGIDESHSFILFGVRSERLDGTLQEIIASIGE